MTKYGPVRTKSRVSSRLSNYGISYLYLLSTGQQYFNGSAGSAIEADSSEKIQYTLSGNKNRRSNWCVHTREKSLTPNPGMTTSLWYSAASPTYRSENTAAVAFLRNSLPMAKAAFDLSLASGLSPVPTKESMLSGWGSSLFTSVREKLEPNLTTVSVPNFLKDFRQMKQLADLWSSRRSLLANVGNANLNYQFGWRPTISDVSKMVSAVFDIHQKLKDWNDNLGVAKLNRAVALNVTTIRSGQTAGWPVPNQILWSGKVVQKVTCFLRYRPRQIPDVQSKLTLIRGALDALGFELNPRILWDAVPFSFIVDWFVDVGRMLNTFRLDTLELPIDIVDVFLQYNELYNLNFTLHKPADADCKRIEFSGGSYERNFFNRMPFGINLEDSLRFGWKMPSLNQAMLFLSLVSTRRT